MPKYLSNDGAIEVYSLCKSVSDLVERSIALLLKSSLVRDRDKKIS